MTNEFFKLTSLLKDKNRDLRISISNNQLELSRSLGKAGNKSTLKLDEKEFHFLIETLAILCDVQEMKNATSIN